MSFATTLTAAGWDPKIIATLAPALDDAVQAAVQSAVAGMLSNQLPLPEAGTAAVGADTSAARGTHQHPRLTSSTGHVLDTNGEATVVFKLPFDPIASTPDAPWPAVDCFYTEAANNQPLVFKVKSWTTNATGQYIGCVVKAYRGSVVTVSLLGTNVNAFSGSAAGVPFTCIAVKRSE